MTDKVIRKVVILGAIAIMSILSVQTYWLYNSWTQNQNEFDQKINIALLQVAKSLAKVNQTTLPSMDLIKKMSSNYYIVNINGKFEVDELEFYLLKVFQEHSLNLDFEYAIHDCTTNKMIYGNYCHWNDTPKEELLTNNLQNYDDFVNYFGIRFPTRDNFVFTKVKGSLAMAFVLLISLLFFGYSLYVILSQKRLSNLQKDFINNMTHEFKTPISTIKISSDVFLKNKYIQENDRLYRYAQIINKQNNRLNNQVEKVLQIAKMDKKDFQISKEEVDIHELIRDMKHSMEVKLDNGYIRLELLAKNNIILADKIHFINILHNLVDNAIKYSFDEVKIIIQTLSENNKTVLTVKDDGIGISKSDLTKVTQKFYRVSTGNIHEVKGFGLGLFYVKKVCDSHQWEFNIYSKPNDGTTVEIIIN